MGYNQEERTVMSPHFYAAKKASRRPGLATVELILLLALLILPTIIFILHLSGAFKKRTPDDTSLVRDQATELQRDDFGN